MINSYVCIQISTVQHSGVMVKKFSNSISKVNQIIDSVNAKIIDGQLTVGDDIPSINEMSKLWGVSRDTVFKAYTELKQRGLIDSTSTKGYFIKEKISNVLLLLDTYSPFKETLFRSFSRHLQENDYKVDILFHQYNERLFKTILQDSIGRYNYYLVMNFSNDRFSEELNDIPLDKLLLLDFGNFDKGDFSYLCQDFNQAFYDCLAQADEQFKRYRKIILFFPKELMHPASAIDYFVRYCTDRKFDFEVIHRDPADQDIQPGCACICLKQQDLVSVVRLCNRYNYKVGKDIGILAYNDMPVLEVIKKGISSISVDFAEMGQKAAGFIQTRQKIQEFLPTRLILRNSL